MRKAWEGYHGTLLIHSHLSFSKIYFLNINLSSYVYEPVNPGLIVASRLFRGNSGTIASSPFLVSRLMHHSLHCHILLIMSLSFVMALVNWSCSYMVQLMIVYYSASGSIRKRQVIMVGLCTCAPLLQLQLPLTKIIMTLYQNTGFASL